MSVTIKTEEQIVLMRKSGHLLAQVHKIMKEELREGMTTLELNRIGEEAIRSYGCIPNFLNYNGYPAAVCISINNEVVHGIPRDYRYIQDGDIVSLDCGLIYKGWHSDAARTIGFGNISKEAKRLIEVTRQSFFEGIRFAKPGNCLDDIALGIQGYTEMNGFSIVRDLCGHGIGTDLHEDPEVLNFVTGEGNLLLQKGMTLAVEPMVNAGDCDVWWLDDEWTVVTADDSLSAHYENTIAITEDGCEILTMLPEEKKGLNLLHVY